MKHTAYLAPIKRFLKEHFTYLALIATVLITAISLYLLKRSAGQYSGVTPEAVRIEFYKLYVDLAKSVLVGFGAALLGILMPAVFSEARHTSNGSEILVPPIVRPRRP